MSTSGLERVYLIVASYSCRFFNFLDDLHSIYRDVPREYWGDAVIMSAGLERVVEPYFWKYAEFLHRLRSIYRPIVNLPYEYWSWQAAVKSESGEGPILPPDWRELRNDGDDYFPRMLASTLEGAHPNDIKDIIINKNLNQYMFVYVYKDDFYFFDTISGNASKVLQPKGREALFAAMYPGVRPQGLIKTEELGV